MTPLPGKNSTEEVGIWIPQILEHVHVFIKCMLMTCWQHRETAESEIWHRLNQGTQRHNARALCCPGRTGRYLHWQRCGLGRVCVLLGDHLLTWQVEPYLSSGSGRGRVDSGIGYRGSAVGPHHGEQSAGLVARRRLLVWAGHLGGAWRGCGAELHSCGVLQCVFAGLDLKRSPAGQPATSHQPPALPSHL